MYAVVQTGGKQYRVSPGDVIIVDRLTGVGGDKIELDNVLMLDDGSKVQVGKPLLDKAMIITTIIEQSRADKIIVFKKKRRKGYRRKHGHRQHQTVLRVMEIKGEGVSAKAPAAKSVKAETAPAAKSVKAETAKPAISEAKAPEAKVPEAKVAVKSAKKAEPTKKATATKTAPKKTAAPKKPDAAKKTAAKPSTKKSK